MSGFLDSFDFEKPLSLYVHVPFCTSKCSYCAFYSLPGCSEDLMDRYTRRLLSEISAVNDAMKGRPFATAFIGGGNPGCLGPDRLGLIADAVCANGRPSEFSVEMNPESLEPGFFPLFENCFTRLSMGVQSLSDRALGFLGRNADRSDTLHGLSLSQSLREKTRCKLNYDLITCLGSWHDAVSDVKGVVSGYHPDHLSVYALTLEEGTPLYRKHPDLPDPDEQYDILMPVWKVLEGYGYEHYEVSNFALGGARCVHNCRYWGYEQYLGLGPGAASTAFGKDGSVTRFSFEPSVASYCGKDSSCGKDASCGEGSCGEGACSGKGVFSGCEEEKLSAKEAFEELVFMGLRCKGGLDIDRAGALLGRHLEGPRLAELAGRGFELSGGFLVPTDDGLMLSDAAALSIIGAFC